MEPDSSASPAASSLRARGRHRTPTVSRTILENEADIAIDVYRNVVFPNRIREQRMRHGYPKLYAFSGKFQNIPYIRLSKMERGEVFAKADELRSIADVLELAPLDLLLDVEVEEFDIGLWYSPFAEGALLDTLEESTFAHLLAAAVRARRASSDNLTAATMARDYAIPPVILSRLENAHKGLERWNDQIIKNLCRLFNVPDKSELKALVNSQYEKGELSEFLSDLPNAASRYERTRDRVAGLRKELGRTLPALSQTRSAKLSAVPSRNFIPVFGSLLADGLVAMTSTGLEIEATAAAGPRSFGVRIGRATLGGGLPGNATLIVDPDRFPQAGGLALVKESAGFRVLSVAVGRDGAMIGYSITPPLEVSLDAHAPGDLAAVVAAIFV